MGDGGARVRSDDILVIRSDEWSHSLGNHNVVKTAALLPLQGQIDCACYYMCEELVVSVNIQQTGVRG